MESSYTEKPLLGYFLLLFFFTWQNEECHHIKIYMTILQFNPTQWDFSPSWLWTALYMIPTRVVAPNTNYIFMTHIALSSHLWQQWNFQEMIDQAITKLIVLFIFITTAKTFQKKFCFGVHTPMNLKQVEHHYFSTQYWNQTIFLPEKKF